MLIRGTISKSRPPRTYTHTYTIRYTASEIPVRARVTVERFSKTPSSICGWCENRRFSICRPRRFYSERYSSDDKERVSASAPVCTPLMSLLLLFYRESDRRNSCKHVNVVWWHGILNISKKQIEFRSRVLHFLMSIPAYDAGIDQKSSKIIYQILFSAAFAREIFLLSFL